MVVKYVNLSSANLSLIFPVHKSNTPPLAD